MAQLSDPVADVYFERPLIQIEIHHSSIKFDAISHTQISNENSVEKRVSYTRFIIVANGMKKEIEYERNGKWMKKRKSV